MYYSGATWVSWRLKSLAVRLSYMLYAWHAAYSHPYRYCLIINGNPSKCNVHPSPDDVIKWKHFPRYWPFVRGIHRSPVNSPHKGQWRRTLKVLLICAWRNGWVSNREAGDWRRQCAHYDVIVMKTHVASILLKPVRKRLFMLPPFW